MLQGDSPVTAFLTPPLQDLAPEGWARIDEIIIRALPYSIRLNDAFNLLLVVPTGLAAAWRDASSDALVSSGSAQHQPVADEQPGAVAAVSNPPVRLFLQSRGEVLGSTPLALGWRTRLPEEGTASLELIVLGWELLAGNLRGSGDFGARISLAWRALDRASASFSTPPVHPAVLRRQEVQI